MASFVSRALLLLSAAAAAFASGHAAPIALTNDSAHTLPIFFFHGLVANAQAGYFLQQNLSTSERPFVALNFCDDLCTFQELNKQTKLATDQIKSTVANDPRFARGYVFLAHSQGAAIARAVIEEMDDHKVHTFISLAGASNGIFYGPQASDFLPAQLFLYGFAPLMVNQTLLNTSTYNDNDLRTGRLSIDSIKLHIAHPELQEAGSGYQLSRSPVKSKWVTYNKFVAVKNNLQPLTSLQVLTDKLRRKRNFLKLQAAHFFASSYDETISPWQSSIMGQYNDVASVEALEANFSKLQIITMEETEEYKWDTYGLRTLHARGGVSLHVLENVGHVCWIADATPYGRTEECKFQPVFEKSVYPLLMPLTKQ